MLPWLFVVLTGLAPPDAPSGDSAAPAEIEETALMKILATELDASMQGLVSGDEVKPYFLSYTVTDISTVQLRAELGALGAANDGRRRVFDIDVRVGDYALDNTRKLRGGRAGRGGGGGFGRGGARTVPLDDSAAAMRHALWRGTDSAFKSAVSRYDQVLVNQKTVVEDENAAHDFSKETATQFVGEEVAISIDMEAWKDRVRQVSKIALEFPIIQSSDVALVGTAENRTMVSSEGTRLRTGRELWRVVVSASSRAEDGMEISQSHIFDASGEDGLPSAEEMETKFREVIAMVLALREAPLVEPYTGPAILVNRASAVFFHEIFGHRIEGHRQKDVDEGQTFTKMVGKPILPEFLSVFDDPTRAEFSGEDLRGNYRYDDEGVAGQRVDLVEDGVLLTFLLSRSPVPGFDRSNGHGRREPGRPAVSRQGNLIVESKNAVPYARLKEMLIEECKKQEKPYGYLFQDITGGFTTTGRGGPQAFKVLPVVVYRVHADGSPDELVRGVDIVGTPLSCFSKILCTGDDAAVFNGSCGAESGWVPVSAISPSILVEQIEIEKRERAQERQPILSPPYGGSSEGASGARDGRL